MESLKISDRAKNISPSPTLSIDAQAKKMTAEGIKVVNFGVGEPDFDTPENIKQAAIKAIKEGMTRYTPVAGIEPLRQAIVKKLAEDNDLHYETSQIVVSDGAKHSLYNTFQVLCQEGDEVILPAPYWVTYLEQIKLTGATPVIISTGVRDSFKITPEQIQKAITPRTKIFVINSPGNPAGVVYTKEELAALGEILEKNKIIIISDEIYEKIIYDDRKHVSIASLTPGLKELTIVINGVSKAYAMTGWRIGYAAASQQVAKAMSDLQSHSTSNPASMAQAAALEALIGNQDSVRQMVEEFVKRRDYMVGRLNAIPGVTCDCPGGSFYVFPDVEPLLGKIISGEKINNVSDLARILLVKERVAIVPGVAFGNDNCFRLSYATSMEDIQTGLDLIEKTLTNLG